jgi:hypothetical protein
VNKKKKKRIKVNVYITEKKERKIEKRFLGV